MPKKIFIIDDADFMVDMLRLLVSDAGYEVVGVASNGPEALSLLAQMEKDSLPDIITVDFHMPKMDGLKTIQEIRVLMPNVKVMLITSHATLPVVLRAREEGVGSFIAKPFEPQTLLNTIEALV